MPKPSFSTSSSKIDARDEQSSSHRDSGRERDPVIIDANMDTALREFFRRTEGAMTCTEMPFDELLRREEACPVTEEIDPDTLMFIRAQAIRTMFRYLQAEGQHPLKMMKRLFAMGRGLDIEPFNKLTMAEAGLMFSETKAAHSWRMKVLSGMIETSGMKGSRLPGQKSKSGTANYSAAQMGNENRKNGKKKMLPRDDQKAA